MPRYIDFVAEEEGLVARAELWDERAPRTCALVWDLLPLTGHAHHAIYSGAEVALVLPAYHALEPEHATSAVLPWEIGFVSLRRADHFDVEADFSELCFFYDRGARPSMLEGPVKVNLFAALRLRAGGAVPPVLPHAEGGAEALLRAPGAEPPGLRPSAAPTRNDTRQRMIPP